MDKKLINRNCYKYRFSLRFSREKVTIFLRKFKNPSLGIKSQEASSRENLVVIKNIVDTDNTMISFEESCKSKRDCKFC